MADSYQPIYDAIIRRFGHVDAASAIQSGIANSMPGQHAILETIACAIRDSLPSAEAMIDVLKIAAKPSVMYRPTLWQAAQTGPCLDPNRQPLLGGSVVDKGEWLMILGQMVGRGRTPQEAADDFDQRWVGVI